MAYEMTSLEANQLPRLVKMQKLAIGINIKGSDWLDKRVLAEYMAGERSASGNEPFMRFDE